MNRDLGQRDQVFRCECGEHAFFVHRAPEEWEEGGTPEIWVEVVLNKRTLLERIIIGLKYIFCNKQPLLDEYMFGPDACSRLIEYLQPVAGWKQNITAIC